MKINADCFTCSINHFLHSVPKRSENDSKKINLIQNALIQLNNLERFATPPELFAALWKSADENSSEKIDPMREEKRKSTELGLKLLPDLQKIVRHSQNPFETALRFAIGGNIIDYGADINFNLTKAKEEIYKVLNFPLDPKVVTNLYNKIKKAKKILYILDNCGEAVLDRLLLELIADKVTVGVRGYPILNDATEKDAIDSGIDFAPIISTGDYAPGVSLKNSSPKFLETLFQSDLVIAKGQGNVESLEEDFPNPIFFLLRVKCKAIAKHLQVPQGSIQVIGKNMNQ